MNVKSTTDGIFDYIIISIVLYFKMGITTGDDYDHCSCSLF